MVAANRMIKAWTAFAMIAMLIFGSIGVPALADSGNSYHAVELVDLECHDHGERDGDQRDAPANPSAHVDHHHCSVAIPMCAASSGSAPAYANSALPWLTDSRMTSYQTAPPTQPPSA